MLSTLALTFLPPLAYWALAWALRPAAVLATCGAPIGWAALAFAGTLHHFGTGGSLPQVSIFLAVGAAAAAALGAFLGALGMMGRDRAGASALAFANGCAWIAAFAIGLWL